MKTVLAVHPLDYGVNPGIDAMLHGLDHRLSEAGLEMRVVHADFRTEEWPVITQESVRAGIAHGVAAIVLYVIDPDVLSVSVAEARAAGVSVFTFARPPFAVTGALVYPNFNQGLYLAEYMATLIPSGARVGVLGGPGVSDDSEEVAGIVYGIKRYGLTLVTDMDNERYWNRTDARPGGREAALRLLEDVSELDAILPYNDETMLGTLDALDELGRSGHFKLASRNGTPNAVQALKNGKTDGTWDLDCPNMGATLGELVVCNVVDREALENELVMSPVGRLITRQNVANWIPWSDRVPQTPFKIGLEESVG